MRIFCQKFLAQFLTKLRIQTLPWNLKTDRAQPRSSLWFTGWMRLPNCWPSPLVLPTTFAIPPIAQLLAISPRAAYNLCNTTKDFRVVRIGTSIRVNRQSFDAWFAAL